MLKVLVAVAAVVLLLHGLIHLMGTASYLKFATVEGLPYKTTVLGGRWDLGAGGIAAFGVLWGMAALGFVATALAFWFGWSWWQPALVGVTLVSLVLTALDWDVAYAGVGINLAILLLLWLRPSLSTWFTFGS
ncbi:MAG TPA: hypothetical protein P5121_32410 [Caldilineaceae bacterium]|nr:hypothetical protein [Caldilineaceae bacterium]